MVLEGQVFVDMYFSPFLSFFFSLIWTLLVAMHSRTPTSLWGPFESSNFCSAMIQSFGGPTLPAGTVTLKKDKIFFIQTVKLHHFRYLITEQIVVLHLISSLHTRMSVMSLLIKKYGSGAGFCCIIGVGIQQKVDRFRGNCFYE